MVSLQAKSELMIYCCSFNFKDLPFFIDKDFEIILEMKSDSLKLSSGTSFLTLNISSLKDSFKFTVSINDGIALIIIGFGLGFLFNSYQTTQEQ